MSVGLMLLFVQSHTYSHSSNSADCTARQSKQFLAQKDVMQHIPKKRKRTWNPGPRWNPSEHNDEVAEVEFPQPSEAEDVFRATAARIRVFRAFSLTLSPSRKSMARLALPSRLELKRPEGSSNEAPLENVIFTTFL